MADENTFCLKITKMDGYYHAICQGEITFHAVLQGWTHLAHLCFKENVRKIICQPHSGPAEFLDVYQFGVSFRDIVWPEGMRIAVVCDREDLGRYQMVDTMVRNLRGPESRIFSELDQAKNWIFSG